MRLVLVIPPAGRLATEQRIALRDEPIDIGGASDCDAVIDHPSVGTARVRLERRGEDWVVIDREGKGVCAVGGIALRPREPRIVRPPHVLRLGDVDLVLAFDPIDSHGGETREVALRAAAFVVEMAPQRPRVRVVEGPRMGETLDLTHAGPYRVGRGKSCDLFLDAADASREHFSLEVRGDHVVVRDLGSPRGTYVGKNRLDPNREAVWEPTRMVRAADTVLSLEVATPDNHARLLAPLERIPDGAAPAASVATSSPEAADAVEAPPETPTGPVSASLATEPVGGSSPATELPHDLPRPRVGTGRDPSFVILVLAVVVGVAGVAALLALLIW
ncbi:hypothetical protein BH11MYX4_BH11MYX4_36590 [soil metagenome]